MRTLPTRIHGSLDYFIGMMLMALPWLLDFERGGMETLSLTVTGTALLLYNMVTDHELGLVPWIPVPVHLALDTVAGTFVAATPWMFGFVDVAVLPHVGFGLLLIASAALTRSTRERAAHLAW